MKSLPHLRTALTAEMFHTVELVTSDEDDGGIDCKTPLHRYIKIPIIMDIFELNILQTKGHKL